MSFPDKNSEQNDNTVATIEQKSNQFLLLFQKRAAIPIIKAPYTTTSYSQLFKAFLIAFICSNNGLLSLYQLKLKRKASSQKYFKDWFRKKYKTMGIVTVKKPIVRAIPRFSSEATNEVLLLIIAYKRKGSRGNI